MKDILIGESLIGDGNEVAHIDLLIGPKNGPVAKAVADSVADNIIPQAEAENLVVIVGVFIHWEASDKKKIYDFNYRATKESIARAMKGEPSVKSVIAGKDKAKHPFA